MKFFLLCLFAFAAASDCVGSFCAWKPCQGACGAQSVQTRDYRIEIPADAYGRPCPFENGHVETQPCTVLCPANDCQGAWEAPLPCVSKGVCGSDAGTTTRTYKVTRPQGPGGAACPIADGTQEQLTCSAPVVPCQACEGDFGPWSACVSTATKCGDNSGQQTRSFHITKAAGPGGAACAFTEGFVQTQRCAATATPCKGCVGSFGDYTPCESDGICDSASGKHRRTYKITEPGEPGGATCPFADGHVSVEQCNTAPVRPCQHCVGAWSAYTECVSDGKCGSAAGKRSRTYTITTPAGSDAGCHQCPAADKAVEITECRAPVTPCRGCSGSWSEYSPCVSDGVCSSDAGKRTRTYTVHDAGEPGGAPCAAPNNFVETSVCSATPVIPCAPEDGEGGFGAWGQCVAIGCGTTEGKHSRTYTITKQPKYGGKPCAFENGHVETEACTATLTPCPVPCVGSFVDGPCVSDGVCSSAAGKRKSTFTITVEAAHGGAACKYKNGFVKTTKCATDVIVPCPPRDAVGKWSDWTPCKARSCGSTVGDQSSTYTVLVTAAYGGKPCEAANGQVRTQECTAQLVNCPVHCIGAFSPYTECKSKGVCSSSAGTRSRTYAISVPAAYGGNQCRHTNGQVETVDCNDAPVTPCPPEPCVGKWNAGSCSQTKCGDAAGTEVQTFSISHEARYGGTQCEAKAGDKRTVSCSVADIRPCPIDCKGKYTEFTQCKPSAACGTTRGTRTRVYKVEQVSLYGGQQCPRVHNDIETEDCPVELVKCPPVDCQGYFVAAPCVQNKCHDEHKDAPGTEHQIYRIKQDALYEGKPCPHKHNEIVPKPCTVPASKVERCPIHCEGKWSELSECKAIEECGCARGTQFKTYHVSRVAEFGGKQCPHAHQEKEVTKCLVPENKVERCPNALLDAPCEDLSELLVDVKKSRCVLESLLKALENKK